MSNIQIKKISITDLDTDAIVNAANEGLMAGGGVCGAIFKAAGYDQLQAACDAIGYCPTGSAVITPGFDLKSKYIIHAVGPVWRDGKHNEPQHLYGAYRRSLELAAENGCHSIGFPLISAGIFGYPLEGAWRKALQACRDFIEKNPENDIDIVFAVLDPMIIALGEKTLLDVAPNLSTNSDKKQTLWIGKHEYDAVFFHLPTEPDGYLSNWYNSPFDLDGMHFSSVEQYIMYQKCITFGDTESAKAVMATDDPARHQTIGKAASGYNDKVWAGMRQLVAMRALYAKFTQNPELRQKLLDTGDAYLVECAYSDTTWACGIRLSDDKRHDISNWRGTNILGFALMEVRERIRSNNICNRLLAQ